MAVQKKYRRPNYRPQRRKLWGKPKKDQKVDQDDEKTEQDMGKEAA